MTASMTGFGRGTAQVGDTTATVEMRSVNNRFVDINVRMPRNLAAYESDLQKRIKEAFSRGRISVQVQVEQQADALPTHVNPALAQGYHRALTTLRDACGLDEPVRLDHLLKFSDIFSQPEETPEQVEEAWTAVQEALEGAIEAMRVMRLREGAALADDLLARIDHIEACLDEVETFAPERITQARERLHERLGELAGDARLDPERLEQEIVILADKLDVTEECVRLRSHFPVFRDAFKLPEPIGRKLNFLSQEINREINTIGSKANNATVAHLVVQMKEQLEKIREQVENVE